MNRNSQSENKDKIELDLTKIVSTLENEISSLEAIFLVGSFGRNEGSVLHYENSPRIINDYDLVIVVSENNNSFDVDRIRRDLEEELSVRQVDITCYTKNKLKSLSYTMYSYDLKYASRLLYGKKEILDLIPEMDKTRMPVLEAIRPLLLFPVSLLQAYPNPRENMSEIDLFWSYQQVVKSILGWSTAILILNGKYDPSYSQRQKNIKELYKDNKEEAFLVEKATEFKLNPTIKPIKEEDFFNFWTESTLVHLEKTIEVLSKFYKTGSNLEDISSKYRYSIRNTLKMIVTSILNIDKRSMINIEIGQLYLCKALCVQNSTTKDDLLNLALIEAFEAKKYSGYSEEINKENLIESFILMNPNSSNWFRKGNKLSY